MNPHDPYWQRRIALAPGLIINGNGYLDKGWTDPDSHNLGYDGSVFTYQQLDSATPTTTNNLWHQGEVPPQHRDQLPDNTIIIEVRPASAADALDYIEAKTHYPIPECDCGHERRDHAMNVGPCNKPGPPVFDPDTQRMIRRCHCDAYAASQT